MPEMSGDHFDDDSGTGDSLSRRARSRALAVRIGLIALATTGWLARLALGGTATLLIAIGLSLLVVPVIYWESFRYVGRERGRVEVTPQHPLGTLAPRNASVAKNDSAEIYRVFAGVHLSRDPATKHDFPDLRLRRTLSSFIQGNRAGGRLTIRRDGLHFRARRWPMSIGVWGTFFIPWVAVKHVHVTDPSSGRSSSLGGALEVSVPAYRIKTLNLEFFGSREAVGAALAEAGAPVS